MSAVATAPLPPLILHRLKLLPVDPFEGHRVDPRAAGLRLKIVKPHPAAERKLLLGRIADLEHDNVVPLCHEPRKVCLHLLRIQHQIRHQRRESSPLAPLDLHSQALG